MIRHIPARNVQAAAGKNSKGEMRLQNPPWPHIHKGVAIRRLSVAS
jgi:hypothetical protein